MYTKLLLSIAMYKGEIMTKELPKNYTIEDLIDRFGDILISEFQFMRETINSDQVSERILVALVAALLTTLSHKASIVPITGDRTVLTLSLPPEKALELFNANQDQYEVSLSENNTTVH